MASAIYIFDHEYNLLIHRQYMEDLSVSLVLDLYKSARSVKDFKQQFEPLLQYKGNSFVQIKYDELVFMSRVQSDTDLVVVLTFLSKFGDLLKCYFVHYKLALKAHQLTVDLIKDNYILIYELFDECFDYGVPQLTDFSILKEYIKLMIKPEDYYDNSHFSEQVDYIKKQVEQDINSSVSRTAMTKISWRPKGIFYNKNELFVDCNEYVTFKYNYKNNKVILNKISGEMICKSYLSGMPSVRLGLNETFSAGRTIFNDVQYHQCVDLQNLNSNIVEFIPPDGTFKLLSYHILDTKVLQPLIYVKPTYKIYAKGDTYKFRIKVELVTTFKRKYTMNDISIKIPLIIKHPILLINFNTMMKYKTKLGSVIHKLEDDCLAWNISRLQGTINGEMMAEFDLITEKQLWKLHEENSLRSKQERNDLYYFDLSQELNKLSGIDDDVDESKAITSRFNDIMRNRNTATEVENALLVSFTMDGTTYSGVEISFLNVTEEQLKFESFNWKFHHAIARNADYSFILDESQFTNMITEEQEQNLALTEKWQGSIPGVSEVARDVSAAVETNDTSTALDDVKYHVKELKKHKISNPEFEEYIAEGEETVFNNHKEPNVEEH